MKLRRLVVSDFMTNCYILYDDQDAFVIDPGANAKKIKSFLEENHLNINCILLTHGHIDHIGAVEALYNQYHCDVYIHEDDQILLDDPRKNLSGVFSDSYVLTVPTKYYDEYMTINNHEIKIHHTPGHTPGSCMIEFIHENVIFSGDMLFKDSIGRTDFPTSKPYDMKKSIEYIKTLDYDRHVLPGHNEPTTLQYEIHNNPWFK